MEKEIGVLTYYGQLKSAIKILLFFCGFCLSVPFLFISYTCVTLSRKLLLVFLSSRYSHLQFVKTSNVRSLVDTSRNPGVFDILMTINGECDVDIVKKKFVESVLNRKDKFGEYIFRRLKSTLVSCWGHYAWIQRDFNINNHILLHSTLFRGRTISEQNIQDCVSYLISRYMPSDIPPWQIILIPSSEYLGKFDPMQEQTKRYYILVRMHHLILDEEPQLNISDILLLTTRKSSNSSKDFQQKISPFHNLMFEPVFIPKLYSRISVGITNRWNEFIYRYDPLESPDCDKRHVSSIFQLLSVYLIMTVTVINDFWKGYNAIQNNPKIKFLFFRNLVKREMNRRNVNWETFFNTIHPWNIIKNYIALIWWICMTFLLMWPYFLYRELMAIKCCLFMGHYGYPSTIVGFLYEYTPLLFNTLKEIISISTVIITMPKFIYEELFEKRNRELHSLQKLSLCGRKVISWSESVSKNDLKQITNATGFTETEILLSMTSHCLKEFMIEITAEGVELPETIDMSVRCIRHDYLFGQSKYNKDVTGFSCLTLPLNPIDINQLKNIRDIIALTRSKQVTLFLLTSALVRYDGLTKILPAVWMKLLLNFLSKHFAVTLTEVLSSTCELDYNTLFGHTIENIIFFRPPQSNISLSLTLQRFGSNIRLGVMADAEIHPKQRRISNNWHNCIHKFLNK